MDNWLERFTDEQLRKRRENLYYLTCRLYLQVCTFADERDKTMYDDMMAQLKEVDGEIERRAKNVNAQ